MSEKYSSPLDDGRLPDTTRMVDITDPKGPARPLSTIYGGWRDTIHKMTENLAEYTPDEHTNITRMAITEGIWQSEGEAAMAIATAAAQVATAAETTVASPLAEVYPVQIGKLDIPEEVMAVAPTFVPEVAAV